MKVIVCGIDRLGKDTLINGLINEFGYHHIIHYSSPKHCDFYKNEISPDGFDEKQIFQYSSFNQGFRLLESNTNVIFNRFHLGEYVYSPRYRNYSGEYVFELEQLFPQALDEVRLILLTTSNMFIMDDDGNSHNFEKREEEQESFIEAFNLSGIKQKYIIDVYDSFGDHYRPKKCILDEVCSKIVN
jgi:thymidylate kinase